jgi:hypothetical protein
VRSVSPGGTPLPGAAAPATVPLSLFALSAALTEAFAAYVPTRAESATTSASAPRQAAPPSRGATPDRGSAAAARVRRAGVGARG